MVGWWVGYLISVICLCSRSLSVSVYVSVCLSPFLSLCLSLCLCHYLCLCLSMSLSLSVSVSILFAISISRNFFEDFSLFPFRFLSPFCALLSVSLSVVRYFYFCLSVLNCVWAWACGAGRVGGCGGSQHVGLPAHVLHAGRRPHRDLPRLLHPVLVMGWAVIVVSFVWLVGWMVGWLDGWLVGRLIKSCFRFLAFVCLFVFVLLLSVFVLLLLLVLFFLLFHSCFSFFLLFLRKEGGGLVGGWSEAERVFPSFLSTFLPSFRAVFLRFLISFLFLSFFVFVVPPFFTVCLYFFPVFLP